MIWRKGWIRPILHIVLVQFIPLIKSSLFILFFISSWCNASYSSMAPTFLCPDVEISSSCCFFLLAAFLAAFWSLKQQVSSILIDIYPPPGSGPLLHHHHHTAASSSAYQGLKINKQHILYGIFIIYQYVWGTVKHTLALLLYWNELNICFAVTLNVELTIVDSGPVLQTVLRIRIRIKKGLPDLDPDSGGTKAQTIYRFISWIQNWKIKSKDPFVILKIIFSLLNFNDFLMSFWKIQLKIFWCNFSSLAFTP